MGAVAIKKLAQLRRSLKFAFELKAKGALRAGPHPWTALECNSEESFEKRALS